MNMKQTKRALSLALLAGSLVASILVSELAEAGVEKIILTNEMITDAETGNQGFKILNPKHEADITFTNTGFEIKYENADGKVQTIRVFADFPPITEKAESEGEARYNRLMNAAMKSDGSRMGAFIVKGTAKGIAEAGGLLVLKFDATHKVGFVVMDYGYSEVTMMSPGTLPNVLRDAVRNSLSSQINETVGAQMHHEAQAKRNPVGFMDGQKAVAWGGPKLLPTCEALFVSAAP